MKLLINILKKITIKYWVEALVLACLLTSLSSSPIRNGMELIAILILSTNLIIRGLRKNGLLRSKR